MGACNLDYFNDTYQYNILFRPYCSLLISQDKGSL